MENRRLVAEVIRKLEAIAIKSAQPCCTSENSPGESASRREGNGKRPTLKEDDAVSRHVGDESRIPFLQAARGEHDLYLARRI